MCVSPHSAQDDVKLDRSGFVGQSDSSSIMTTTVKCWQTLLKLPEIAIARIYVGHISLTLNDVSVH